MCVYCGTMKYRQIYKNHYGPIPKDAEGRAYEIHHIDGKHSNSDPLNLKAVSIQEHYEIHYSRGDWFACLRIGAKMKMSAAQISEMATLGNLKRVKNGTNPFVGGKINKMQLENGT